MPKPIKRHTAIQPISREHHQDLLLCWKIRTGFRKGVKAERIKKYVDWFYGEHVISHFEAEEKFLFPILGKEHVLIQKALTHHRRLNRLFQAEKDLVKNLHKIEEELEQHVRFEERELFNEIQQKASTEELRIMEELLEEKAFVENTTDEFWL